MSRYRVGGHWGVTILQEGVLPEDEEGRRPDDKLIGMIDSAAPEWLPDWICTLLNADICTCGHEGLDPMFHVVDDCPIGETWRKRGPRS